MVYPIAASQGIADAVDWDVLSIVEIRGLTAYSGERLSLFDADVTAAAASACMFGRTDWAVMLSCCACLWHEVKLKLIDQGKITLDGLLEKLRGNDAAELVAKYKDKHGFSPHPFVLASQFVQETDGQSPPKRGKKRA